MQSMAKIFSLRHAVRAGILLACLLATSPAFAGDDVSVSTNDGYGRILLNLAPLAHAKATAAGGVFTIAFDRKVSVDPAQIAQTLSGFYENCPILPEADPKIRASRLSLATAVLRQLELSLDLLGVQPVERM